MLIKYTYYMSKSYCPKTLCMTNTKCVPPLTMTGYTSYTTADSGNKKRKISAHPTPT